MATAAAASEYASKLVKYRALGELADRTIDRTVVAASEDGVAQAVIAQMLDVSQAAVSKRLGKAAHLPEVDSPYDVALRCNAGEMTRADMVSTLIAWPYRPRPTGLDESMVDVAGSLDEVIRAHDRGFLTDQEYDAILRGVETQGTTT
jgi:hypothetical protein